MKHFILLLLFISHLFSTVGFSMNEHQCGRKKSYSFFGVSLPSSCKCNHLQNKHKRSCCKDKKVFVKAETNDKLVKKAFLLKKEINEKPFLVANQLYSQKNIYSLHKINFQTEFSSTHSPPLYILHNVFRI